MTDHEPLRLSRQGRRRSRTVASALLGIVGVVGLLGSVLGVWVHREVFDESAVAGAVDVALQDPEVTGALAHRLANQVVEAATSEQIIDERLPGLLAPIQPLVVDGARRIVGEQAARLLADDRVRAEVVDAAVVSHRRVVHVLEGGSLLDGTRTSVADDAVRLNLLPLAARALIEVQDRTGLFASLDVPDLEPGGDPDEQRRELSEAIGRDLPEDFAQPAVYRHEAIARAGAVVARTQHAVVVLRRSLAVVVGVTVVAVVGSVALARRRLRAAAVLTAGVVVVAAIGRTLVRTVVSDAAATVDDPGAVRAVRLVGEELTSGLVTAFRLAAVLALALVVAALVRRADSAPGSEAT